MGFGVPISIDQKVVCNGGSDIAGASIVNDITALSEDQGVSVY